jgi:flagellin-like hook-associated protein FlgL
MRIKPNIQDSIAAELRKTDLNKPVAIPANEQMLIDTRKTKGEKGVNLAATSDDALQTVLEELSSLKIWVEKENRGTLKEADKNVIQKRMDMIKANIQRQLSNTEFGKVKYLDNNPKEAQGKFMNIKDASLEALGIEGIGKNIQSSVNDIDKAINLVQAAVKKSESGSFNSESVKRFSQHARNSVLSRQTNLEAAKKFSNVTNRQQLIEKFKGKTSTKDNGFEKIRNMN